MINNDCKFGIVVRMKIVEMLASSENEDRENYGNNENHLDHFDRRSVLGGFLLFTVCCLFSPPRKHSFDLKD